MKWTIKWQDKNYNLEWFDDINFEKLSNVTQCYCFIFDEKNKLCIVKFSFKNNWTLPGGTPEKYDKNFEETIKREIDEEADLKIKNLKRVGYLKVNSEKNPKDFIYQTRFVAKVDKINKQTIDPAENEIPKRKFISIKDFEKYTHWGNDGQFQLKKALKKLNHN